VFLSELVKISFKVFGAKDVRSVLHLAFRDDTPQADI